MGVEAVALHFADLASAMDSWIRAIEQEGRTTQGHGNRLPDTSAGSRATRARLATELTKDRVSVRGVASPGCGGDCLKSDREEVETFPPGVHPQDWHLRGDTDTREEQVIRNAVL